MEAQLEEQRAHIELLKAKARQAVADGKIMAYEELADAESKFESAKTRLKELGAASEGAFDEMETRLRECVEQFHDVLSQGGGQIQVAAELRRGSVIFLLILIRLFQRLGLEEDWLERGFAVEFRPCSSKLRSMNLKLLFGAALLLATLIFTLQNAAAVNVKFLAWTFSTSLALVIFVTLASGFIGGWAITSALRLKSKMRSA